MANLNLQSDQKPFTMVKNAIIDSEDILDEHEKLLYVVLLRYGNKAFPSLATLSRKCGFSKRTVQRTIDSLIDKGLLRKKNRISKKTGNTSNIYTLIDNDRIWFSSKENLQKNVEKSILEDAVRIVESSGMTVIGKEKGLDNEPAKVDYQAPKQLNQYFIDDNNTTKNIDCQVPDPAPVGRERYTMDQIRQLYDYNAMLNDHPLRQRDIDAAMSVLYDTLNSTRETIRVSGQDKPAMVVIGKLMRLDKDCILYALNKYSEQTERIKNPKSYLLTLLYGSKEQMHLDVSNQVSHDMAVWDALEGDPDGGADKQQK